MMWKDWKFQQRLAFLRWFLPAIVLLAVLAYQTLLFPWIHHEVGIFYHSVLEILFYGVVGAVFLYLALNWVSKGVAQKEQAERLVREKDRLLASITESSAEAIISLDREWQIRFWNRGARMMFGHEEAHVRGRPLQQLLLPDRADEFEEIRASVARRGYVLNHETTMWQHDGLALPVELTLTALDGEPGQVKGYSLVVRDVSLRKRREKMLAEERKRIAGEIHDSFAQDLFSATLKLDLCHKLVQQKDFSRLEEELELIRSVLKRGLKDVRRAIFALHPVDLEELGFGAAVRGLMEQFDQFHEFALKLEFHHEEQRLPKRLEAILFRALQESLSNVAKHAQAHHVCARLDLNDCSQATLLVQDDGQGFLVGEVNPHAHYGLTHLREQAQSVGGTFQVESRLGEGTTVRLCIPHDVLPRRCEHGTDQGAGGR